MQKLVTKRVFETLVEVGDRSTLRLLQAVPTVLYNYPFGILPKELGNQLIGAGNQLVGFSRSSVYLKLFQSICEGKKTRVLIDQKILDMIHPDPKIRKLLDQCNTVETYPNPQFDNFDQNPYKIGEQLGKDLSQKFSKDQKFDFLITASDMIAQGCARVLSEHGKKGLKNLQIVGFDKVDALPYFQHPISTIEVPVKQMVNTAIDLLEDYPKAGAKHLAKARFVDE